MKIEAMNNYRITNNLGEVFYVDEVGSCENGFARVKKDDKYGFINGEGIFICEIKYEKVSSFICGRAAVQENGKWGFINEEGKPICEIKYDWVGCFQLEGYAKVEVEKGNEKECYFMNRNGETLLII
jgi:hypothetical protein